MQPAVYIHFAWGTWERAPLLTGELERAIHRSIATTCAELQAQPIAIGGTDDHLHVLVQLPTTLALADLARRCKGSSAHRATHSLAIDRSFKWEAGYGVVSVSPRQLDQVARYIANQRQHHAADTLLPLLEHLQQPITPPKT